MELNYVTNQNPNNVGINGLTQVVVADKNGNIKYKHLKKSNAILTELLGYLGNALNAGTINGINSFGTAAGADGIVFEASTATDNWLGTVMSSTVVSAATSLPYAIFSGSRTISHNGSIRRFYLGYSLLGTTAPVAFSQNFASQTANITVSSGDTISATWTISFIAT